MNISEYKTAANPAKAVYTDKKSEFIAQIAPVQSERDALILLENIRLSHKKARHHCYGYICREPFTERYSDDGEPSGTAGMPILEVLRNNGLTDVVLVVTRYFGGILLGAGGLLRAYSKAAAMAVKEAELLIMRPAVSVKIEAEYACYGIIKSAIADFGGYSENEEFSDITRLTVILPEETLNLFSEHLTDVCGVNAVTFKETKKIFMRRLEK